jgi:trk system potassium uptake protein TrkA
VRIIIIGAGEVGYHIASRLVREQHDIVVVDQSAEMSERVQEELDVMAFRGHGASPSTLEGAGISQADMLIAVTSSDEINLVACLLARQYGVPKRIARINEPDFRDSPLVEAGKHIGIDLLINPSRRGRRNSTFGKGPGSRGGSGFSRGACETAEFSRASASTNCSTTVARFYCPF